MSEPLPKHDFSLWTLEQSKFELNISHPRRPTCEGDFQENICSVLGSQLGQDLHS